MEHLKYTEILQLNKGLAGTIQAKPYRISVLSNVTVNALKEVLEYNCRIHQIEPDIEIGNFDNIVQDSARSSDKDMVIILYDILSVADDLGIFFEDISEEALGSLKSKMEQEIDLIYSNLKSSPAVVFNLFSSAAFEPDYNNLSRIDYLVNTLNDYLKQKSSNNTALINIDKIIRRHGLKQTIDFRFFNSSKAPYTITFLKEYTEAIQPVLLRNNGKLKKALIFDCDNTLWKGILGEDGVDGVEYSEQSAIGKFYRRVQQLAVYLSKRGVIIGLCSKNNPEDVAELLEKDTTVLKKDHIVIEKVNWQDKATNLRAIAAELNIGLDSLVFVDDSLFEINLVKEQLPEILTFTVPVNVSEYPGQLERLVRKYFSLNQSREDTAKTAMYKQQAMRTEAKEAFNSIEDYLASLEISIAIREDDQSQIQRIAQLTQKTNQFNLTTVRYTEQQVESFMNALDDAVFSLSVKDKFGDSGLTGVCITRADETDNKIAVIDTLLMSCRIIGRNIEYSFFNFVVKCLQRKGFERIRASYIPTKKNMQVTDFYTDVGMILRSQTAEGIKVYEIEIKDYQYEQYDYIQLG